MPKEGSHCIYLSMVMIDSVFKMNNSYHLVFLECKYVVKEKNVTNYTEELKVSSDDSDESDEE